MKRFFEPTKGGGQPSPQPASQPAPTGGKAAFRADVLRRLREAHRQAMTSASEVSNPVERWFKEAEMQEMRNSFSTPGSNEKIRLTQPPKF